MTRSHDPYAALRLSEFRLFFIGNTLASLGIQMQTTAVQWEIYVRTRSELSLGYVGLVQFLPVVLLVLLAGQLADRKSRRWIVMTAMGVVMIGSLSLALISATQADHRWMYVSLLAVGIARAFQQPAKHALLPRIVPPESYANAVTWNTTGFHIACVAGPALAGFLIDWFGSTLPVYLLDASSAGCFALAVSRLRERRVGRAAPGGPWDELAAGIRFVRSSRVILGAISLDMFAVLLGGTVMLLPVYAEDILHTGPRGLGWMRAAPAVGALSVAVLIAHRPVERAGRTMLLAVAGFGVATIVFGVSTSFWLSLLMLFFTGAMDNVSVVIRHTLVQTLTPDQLRGRVAAVNSLFIGASNELGGFESGLVAHWFGPVISVVSGGVGTLMVVAGTALGFPELRRHGRLVEPAAASDAREAREAARARI